MGIFGSLFGASGASGDESAGLFETCVSCGEDFPAGEIEDNGECEACANANYSGPRYCCGMIYEDDETNCRSCGESLY